MTTAVFFELDGTLLQRTADTRPLRTVFEAELDTVEQAWLERFDEQYETNLTEMVERPRERALADVCAEFGLDADPATIAERLGDEQLAATTVSDAARTSLQKLAANDDLGVLTDGPREWVDRQLDHHDLAGQFDAVVTSYEAGAHKPDSAPFELARERLPADEYVLVGDDYERDVEGARKAGFVPVHFETDGPDFWQTLNALV